MRPATLATPARTAEISEHAIRDARRHVAVARAAVRLQRELSAMWQGEAIVFLAEAIGRLFRCDHVRVEVQTLSSSTDSPDEPAAAQWSGRSLFSANSGRASSATDDWSDERRPRPPLRQVMIPIDGAAMRLTWMRPADPRDREALATVTGPMLRSLRLPPAELRGRIDDAADRRLRQLDRDPSMLTPRLREVVTLICLGHTVRSAAGELGLSRHTVIDYQKNIHVLLGVRNRAQLVSTLLGGAPGDTTKSDRV